MQPRPSPARRPAGIARDAAAAALAIVGASLFARRVAHGIGFLPFGDEQGHLLGAQAIHRGARLYRGFVDAHGPAIFAAVHAWGWLSGYADLSSARWISPLATLAAALAILLAPPRAGPAPRRTALVASAAWLGLVATIWIVQGLYLVSYFPLGGACLAAELALLAEPAAIRGVRATPRAAAVAGLAGAIACWTAYAFAPTALLLALASLPAGRRTMAGFLAGFAAGALLGIAWIARFADPLGLLAFHVAANQLDYVRYVHFTAANFLSSLRPSLAPDRTVQTVAIAALAGAAALGARAPGRPAARAALLVAVLGLDARGLLGFQDGAFAMVAFAALALGLGRLASRRAGLACALALAAIGGAELAARHATASPSGLDRTGLLRAAHLPLGLSDDAVSLRVRALTAPSDRVLALPYDPGFYLGAGRAPVRGYHEYLPWDADYARHPWFGRERDLCADLPRLRPAVIRWERWRVWGLYDPDRYMACVPALLDRDYRRDPVVPDLWVRRDLPKR